MRMSCLDKAIAVVCLGAVLASGYTFRQDNQRSGNAGIAVGVPMVREYLIAVGGSVYSSPVVVNDTVFIGARDSCVHAYYNGAEIWKRPAHGDVDAAVTYANGRIYAPSRGGMILEIDARTGDSLRSLVNSSFVLSSPAIYDSLMVFGLGERQKVVKACRLEGFGLHDFAWYTDNSQMVYSSPSVKDSILLYGDDGGILHAVNAYSGAPLWTYATGGGVYVSSPAINADLVYFSPGDWDKNIYALNVKTGAVVWRREPALERDAVPIAKTVVMSVLGRSPRQQQAYLSRLKKTAAPASREIAALAALASGRATMAERFVPAGGAATSSPAIGDSNVFVSRMEFGYDFLHRSTLTAFDKRTGAEKWSYSEIVRVAEPAGFCSSPLVCGNVVFAGWPQGRFIAFDCRDGSRLWQDSLEGEMYASPAASNGRVYIATTAGKLVAYRQAAASGESFAQGTYCYPNPARGAVSNIRVSVDKAATMTMTLFNSGEKPVLRMTAGVAPGTPFVYPWNISKVANGAYFASIKVTYADGSVEKKVVKIAVLH